jgi:periplasmic nitrate reductase NapE
MTPSAPLEHRIPMRDRLRAAGIWAAAGAFAGVLVGIIWGWIGYGSFQLGYMAPHVVTSAFSLAFLGAGIALVRTRSPAPYHPPHVAETSPGTASRRTEGIVFFLLAVVIWPFLSVGFVGAYGFLVWMWQIIFGPPGPPH